MYNSATKLRNLHFFSVLIFVGFASTSHGFEIDGEYRSISTERGFELIDPKNIDSEYQSDLTTYSTTPADVLLFNQTRHFSISAGSLSATQFDFQLRAQFIEELSPKLTFKFLRTEQENYEEAANSSVVELEAQVLESPIWISVYGSLSRMKKEDDVGLAIQWRNGSESVLRVFASQPDFTRSERNDLGDFFVGQGPMVSGLKWTIKNERLVNELLLRQEQAVQWRDPNSSRDYLYENRVVSGMHILRDMNSDDSSPGGWSSFRWQVDQKHTGVSTLGAGNQVTSRDTFDRERQEFELRRNTPLGSEAAAEFGAVWMARRWRDENFKELFHQNLGIFVNVIFASGWDIGVEATKFEALGDLSLGSSTIRTDAIESRLNTAYRFQFKNQATLKLALTFDLDRAEGGVFEGGHGQFQTTF